MSRRITIKSSVEILEPDLAKEVVEEMRREGVYSLTFDEQRRAFSNQQYDDIKDNSILHAERRYGLKLQEYSAKLATERLKKRGYSVKTVKEGDKIKIVAKQRVYA